MPPVPDLPKVQLLRETMSDRLVEAAREGANGTVNLRTHGFIDVNVSVEGKLTGGGG
jgi:hypothetical protein